MAEYEDILLDEEAVTPKKSQDAPEKKKSTPLQEFVEIIDAILVAVVASILTLSLVFRTGYVDGPSMTSTLLNGDRYIVSGLFFTPKQGDIVVFQPEMTANDYSLWVKRVIATEGQTIDIREDGKVYVDGVELTELYLDSHQVTLTKSRSKIEFPLTVPQGHVFVMGDNRLDSKDSRDIGCIDTRRILGEVLFRIYPVKDLGFVN